jgi:hypothetical protein
MFSIKIEGIAGVAAAIIIVFAILWAVLKFFVAPQLPSELQYFTYQLAGAFFWIWAIPFIIVVIILVIISLLHTNY